MGFLGDIYRDALPREYPSDSGDSAITAIESAQSPDDGTEMTLPGEHATGEQGTTTSAATAASLAVNPSVTNTLQRDSEAMAQSRVEAQAAPTASDTVKASSAETTFAQINGEHTGSGATAVDLATELTATPQADPATLAVGRAYTHDTKNLSEIQPAVHLPEPALYRESSPADPEEQDIYHPAVSDSVTGLNAQKLNVAGDRHFNNSAEPVDTHNRRHTRMTAKSNRSDLIENSVHPAAGVQVNSPAEAPAATSMIVAGHSITAASAALHTEAAVTGYPDGNIARQPSSAPLTDPPLVPPEGRTGSTEPAATDMGNRSEARHTAPARTVESIAPGLSLNRQDNNESVIDTATPASLLSDLKSSDREPTAGTAALLRAGSETQPQVSEPVMATAIKQPPDVALVSSALAETHAKASPAIANSEVHTALPDNVVTHRTPTPATAEPSLPSTPATPVAFEARQHAGLDAGRATASQRGGVHIGQVEVTVLAPAPPQTTTAPRRGTTPGGLSLASRYFLRGF